VLITIPVLYSSRSAARPPDPGPPETPAPVTLPKPTPARDPKETAAFEALEKARGALKSDPEDLDPVIARFEEAVAAARGTGFLSQAERELRTALQLRSERLSSAIAAGEAEAKAAAAREEFKLAMELLQKALGTAKSPALREAHQAAAEGLRTQVERLRVSVRVQVIEARRRGAEKDVTATLTRVATWGDPAFTDELNLALASVPGPPSPEAGAYRERWLAALGAASTRDYDVAIRTLEEAARDIKNPRVKEEASGDLARLGGVRDLVDGAVRVFGRLEKGEQVSLEFLEGEGRAKRAQGVVLLSGPGWVSVRDEKEVVFVDREELTAQGLLGLLKDRAKSKDASLFLVLERCPREGDLGSLPEKYATYFRESGPVEVPKTEREAGRLFHAAYDLERVWPEGKRKGNTTPVYRRLLAEFGETGFVRRHRVEIAARAAPPTETIFQPDDMKGSGTFLLQSAEKSPSVWFVSAAPAAGSSAENHVELEFEAGADSAWKGWAYVGACCAESLSLYWQVTDLSETSSKGQKISLEPGAPAAMNVKASIPKLPKKHVPSKPGPTLYGWVELPMPKISPAGPKKARLLADRTGLAIKAVILSTIRSAAPGEAEAKDLEQFALPTVKEGLVGWWKLDENAGPSVDSSGNNHPGTWVGNPCRVSPGAPALASNAGSLSLNGAAQYVDVASPSGLPSGASPRSLCGWGKSQSSAEGYRWIASFGAPQQSQAMFIGQKGTTLVGGGFADDLSFTGLWDDQWHHVALTYDGVTARLYWDGVLKASTGKAWNLIPKFATIGRQVGYTSEYWNGQVDDVRVYNRALSDSEIRLLAQRH
jgi:tetratricopeptide (TPR) repeat protein